MKKLFPQWMRKINPIFHQGVNGLNWQPIFIWIFKIIFITWPFICMTGETELFPSLERVYAKNRVHPMFNGTIITIFPAAIIYMDICLMIFLPWAMTCLTSHPLRKNGFVFLHLLHDTLSTSHHL